MRTYISTNNGRGKEVTAGDPTFAHIRGWHAGVRIQAGVDEATGRDWFHVYLTSGSNGGSGDVYLGVVRDTAAGPVWEPKQS